LKAKREDANPKAVGIAGGRMKKRQPIHEPTAGGQLCFIFLSPLGRSYALLPFCSRAALREKRFGEKTQE